MMLADEGVEGGGRAGADAGQGPEPGVLELERLPRVPVAAEQDLEADQDDEQQARQLDQGDGDVDLDGLTNAAVVHGRHEQDGQDGDQLQGRVLVPEHARPVAAPDPGGRERGRGDPEAITAMVTMKLRMVMWNARWT